MTSTSIDRTDAPAKVVPVRMDDALKSRTQDMANDQYEGNFSMVVRRALRELLDREGYGNVKAEAA